MRDSVHDKAKTLFADTMLSNHFFFSITVQHSWAYVLGRNKYFLFYAIFHILLQHTRVWAATSKHKISLVWLPHKLQCGTCEVIFTAVQGKASVQNNATLHTAVKMYCNILWRNHKSHCKGSIWKFCMVLYLLEKASRVHYHICFDGTKFGYDGVCCKSLLYNQSSLNCAHLNKL